MKFELDQVVTYKGKEYKIIGVLVERSDKTSKVMLAIDGKVAIINTEEIK